MLPVARPRIAATVLWAVRRIPDDHALPLFAYRDEVEEQAPEEIAPLPPMTLSEHVLADYQMLRLSLRGYLMFFLRDLFRAEGVMAAGNLGKRRRHGAPASCRHRAHAPDAGRCRRRLHHAQRRDRRCQCGGLAQAVRKIPPRDHGLRVCCWFEGKVQRSPEGVVHLVAERMVDRSDELDRLSEDMTQAPPFRSQAAKHRHPRNVRTVPKSRDFH